MYMGWTRVNCNSINLGILSEHEDLEEIYL